MRIEAKGRSVGRAIVVVVLWVSAAHAGTPCVLPEAYSIALEARTTLFGSVRGVVAVAPSSGTSPLVPGDAVRQANGHAVASCDDVERAAAAAFAKGLPLLLAVDRPEGLVPVLVPARASGTEESGEARPVPVAEGSRGAAIEAASVAATHDAVVTPAVAVADQEVPASARALAVVPSSEPVSNGATARLLPESAAVTGALADANGAARAPEPVRAEAAARAPGPLPPVAAASDELRAHAAQAVGELRRVEARATITVPIGVYERDRSEVDTAVRQIDFGTDEAARAVRAVVFDVLEAYQTASDIIAAKTESQSSMRRELRSRAPRELPFFPDGDVPRWVASFPFLEQAVLAPPSEKRFFVQSSGRWSPDRAVELLWAYARDETTRLATWSASD